jgi:peptidoglycan/LPS O-acetylase OafA/YrhL
MEFLKTDTRSNLIIDGNDDTQNDGEKNQNTAKNTAKNPHKSIKKANNRRDETGKIILPKSLNTGAVPLASFVNPDTSTLVTEKIAAPKIAPNRGLAKKSNKKQVKNKELLLIPEVLRVIGLGLILVYHFMPEQASGGFIGVDIFFVISGYFATITLLNNPNFISYIRRRFLRLFPPLLFTVIFTLISLLLINSDFRQSILKDSAAALSWTTNYYESFFGGSYTDSMFPNFFIHTWTLGVEMQYYILWAAVVCALFFCVKSFYKYAYLIVIAAMMLLGSQILMQLFYTENTDNTAVYFGLHTHATGLIIGSILAIYLQKFAIYNQKNSKKNDTTNTLIIAYTSLVFLILATSLFCEINTAFYYRFGMLLVSIFTAVLIYLNVINVSVFRTVPTPILNISIRSYHIYLIHWPMLELFEKTAPDGYIIAAKLCGILATILVAEICFRLTTKDYYLYGTKWLFERLYNTKYSGLFGFQIMIKNSVYYISYKYFVYAALLIPAYFVVATAPAISQTEAEIANGSRGLQIMEIADDANRLPNLSVVSPVLIQDGRASLPLKPSVSAALAAGGGFDGIQTLDPFDTGQSDAAPVHPITGQSVMIVGDSVCLNAAMEIRQKIPGVDINCSVGRFARQGAEIIRNFADASGGAQYLPETIVIALSTNDVGGLYTYLEDMVNAAGAGHHFVIVTGYGINRPDIARGAVQVRDFASVRPYVTVADWDLAIRPYGPSYLSADGFHPSGHAAREIYAATLAAAINVVSTRPKFGE